MHVFDEAIALSHTGGDRFDGATHPAWANMVGPFGGITAAQLLQAVLQHPQRLGDPVALTVNFCAAVTDGRFTIVMPHPERVFRTAQLSWHPPEWGEDSPWMRMFRNARKWVN